jgi:hypothetical protein
MRPWPNITWYVHVCLEGNICHCGRSAGRDLNPGPPEPEAGTLRFVVLLHAKSKVSLTADRVM